MTETVTAARIASAMEGYGNSIDDVLDREDWDFKGDDAEVWALVDYCPECGTYQRKSELVHHPEDDGNFICRMCLRDL